MSKRLSIFIMFTAAYFLSYFFRLANAVISADLTAELNLTAGQLGLTTSVFFATFAAAQIPIGIGLDRWGPRWVTPSLMFIGALGSALFAFAPTFLWLTVARGLIGLGMAGVLMGSLKIFSQWYPAEQFATMGGLLVGIGSTGSLFAATPLAWLNHQIGWRSVFALMAGITVLVATIIILFSRNTPPDKAWPKSTAGSGGVMQVFTDGRFWRIAPVALIASGTGLAFQGLWAAPYLFDIYQMTDIETGNLLIALGIGATIGFSAGGWLADRFDLVKTILSGTAVFVILQICLAFHPPLPFLWPIFFLFGMVGALSLLVLAHVRRLFPDEITGRAITAINLFSFAGTFLLQWLIGEIIDLFDKTPAGTYPPQAYTTVLLMTAAALALALWHYYPLTYDQSSKLYVNKQ